MSDGPETVTAVSSASALPPPDGPDREIRFAVVMYGGVSLAIYIHGVARELFHLVRATARADTGQAMVAEGSLEAAEKIYRKLSVLLGDQGKDLENSFPQKPNDPKQWDQWRNDLAAWRHKLDQRAKADAGPVRFVVDLISGTSAGGINGVYLAKALVTGQSLAPLRQLWLDQGDLTTLLNDTRVGQLWNRYAAPRQPQSLLDSQHMFRLLFEALEKMQAQATSAPLAPLVKQLDLFLTTTDIRGVPLPIQLADRLVYERRYRHDFQFIYNQEADGSKRNDFTRENHPFLAFASRCTSAFPFAFEPARWVDIPPLLKTPPTAEQWQNWQRNFFPAYAGALDALPAAFRSFGDGGYLNNKPFSYVTESLQTHRADVRVERKLLYVEPSPEHPEAEPTDPAKPDVLENVRAALLDLPLQQTIREDIERLQERNRLLQRVARIRSHLDIDIDRIFTSSAPTDAVLTADEWASLDLGDLARGFNPSYVAYHRLKVSATTDELAELITRLLGLDEASDAFMAVRAIATAWREQNYYEYRDQAPPNRRSQTGFLIRYNFSYRLRRLQFLLTRLSELENPDRAGIVLKPTGLQMSDLGSFKASIRVIRGHVNTLNQKLRRVRRRLRRIPAGDKMSPLARKAQALKAALADTDLALILGAPEEKALAAAAAQFYGEHQAACDDLAQAIGEQLSAIFIATYNDCAWYLKPSSTDPPPLANLKRYLWFYFEYFDNYDQFLYPLIFGTEGEGTEPLDILRVSPDDADLLLDERGAGCHKLGGDRFWHFGGFLDRTWRLSDMLWGRLDAVERLFSALLPVPADQNNPAAVARLSPAMKQRLELRTQLITQAQAAILAEELGGIPAPGKSGSPTPRVPLTVPEGHDLLVEAFAHPKDGLRKDQALCKFVRDLTNPETVYDRQVLDVLNQYMDLPALLRCYRLRLEQIKKPAIEPALRTIARATAIVGHMFDYLAQKYPVDKRITALAVRAGRVACVLVDMAVPRSFPRFLARHWLNVLYLCAALILLAGLIRYQTSLLVYDGFFLGTLIAVDVVLAFLKSVIQNGWLEVRAWWHAFRAAAAVLLFLGLLAAIGLAAAELILHPEDISKACHRWL